MIGQVTITAGINVAAAIYIIGAVTRIFGVPADVEVPVFGSLTNWYFQVLVMAIITVPQVLVNVTGIRLTARLSDFSVWWHIGGVALIILLLAVFGTTHNDPSFLFSTVTSVSPLDASSADLGSGAAVPALVVGTFAMPSPLFALVPGLMDLYQAAPFGLLFVLALLQAQWTFTGYDASAHVAEETYMARVNSAWGVFLSVAVSAVVGYALLLALTWTIPRGDVAATAADAYPVLYIAYNNLTSGLAHLVAITIGVAMWLCGLASVTSMGRMWYAFARDDGVPGSRLLKRVDQRHGTPVWAIVVTSALSILICLYAAAYFVVTSISTIALYLAYGIPILLNLRNRMRRRGEYTTVETAPWNLGRWGTFLNVVAVTWVVFLTVVFSLPPNELVLWTMVLVMAALACFWFGYARGHFVGPARPAEARAAADRG